MRTTLTLEPDVAQNLKEIIRQKNITSKQAVNELMRQGYIALKKSAKQPKAQIKLKTFKFGLGNECKNINFNHLATELEDEDIKYKLTL